MPQTPHAWRVARLTAGAAAALAVAACSSNSTPNPVAPSPQDAVAVVRSGPAVLHLVSTATGATTSSLTLPGAPTSMVVTPDGRQAFLLDTAHADVVPIDLVQGTVGTTIAAGKLPVDEHLSGDGRTLYVTDNLNASVIAIDTTSHRVAKITPTDSGVDGFVPSPTGAAFLVGYYTSVGQPGIVSLLTQSGTGKPISVGNNPISGAQFTPDGRTVWISETGVGSGPDQLYPLDVAAGTVGAPVSVGHDASVGDLTPDGGTLLVANGSDTTVSVVDLVHRRVAATVHACAVPQAPRISRDGRTAWIPCAYGKSMVPLDLATRTVGPAVELGNAPSDLTPAENGHTWVLFPSSPGSLALLSSVGGRLLAPLGVGNAPVLTIASDSSTAWATNTLDDTVQRIDLATRTAGAPIRVPQNPSGAYLTNDHRTLLVVSDADGVAPGSITRVDTASESVSRPIPVGPQPAGAWVSSDGATAVVASRIDNTLTVVDVRAWSVSATVKLSCTPDGVTGTPSGHLYVDCPDSQTLLPVTLPSGAVGAPIAVTTDARLAISPDGTRLLVDGAHTLQMIDTGTNTVIKQQDESGNLLAPQWLPDGRTILTVDNSAGDLLRIDPATLATTRSLAVSSRPAAAQVAGGGRTAYVVDSSSQTLYVIDLAAWKVATTSDVAPNVRAVAVPQRRW